MGAALTLKPKQDDVTHSDIKVLCPWGIRAIKWWNPPWEKNHKHISGNIFNTESENKTYFKNKIRHDKSYKLFFFAIYSQVIKSIKLIFSRLGIMNDCLNPHKMPLKLIKPNTIAFMLFLIA